MRMRRVIVGVIVAAGSPRAVSSQLADLPFLSGNEFLPRRGILSGWHGTLRGRRSFLCVGRCVSCVVFCALGLVFCVRRRGILCFPRVSHWLALYSVCCNNFSCTNIGKYGSALPSPENINLGNC